MMMTMTPLLQMHQSRVIQMALGSNHPCCLQGGWPTGAEPPSAGVITEQSTEHKSEGTSSKAPSHLQSTPSSKTTDESEELSIAGLSTTMLGSVELNQLLALLDGDDDDNLTSESDSNIAPTISEHVHTPTPNQPAQCQHPMQLRPCRPCKYASQYDFHFLTQEEPMGIMFMTEQMSLKCGLQLFGKHGANAVVSEMQQLDYQKVKLPRHTNQLIRNQCLQVLRYLMYLKQKRKKDKSKRMC